MQHILQRLVFISLTLVSLFSYAGTIDPRTPDSRYVEFGKKFNYVGMVCGKHQDGSLFCASGVMIQPKVMITAAHVVKDCTSCYITIGDKKIPIPVVIYHNEFKDNVFGFYDIAVGILEEDAGLDFYPELYEDKDEVGKLCTLSGFGLTGTFVTGAKISDSKRRGGSNYIDEIDRGLIVCSPSGPGKKTSLEFLIASGDSGGGLFIGNKLAGIHSCVMTTGKTPDSRYGHQSGHTRVSDHIDWIKKALSKELN
jgi:hypothetical protein